MHSISWSSFYVIEEWNPIHWSKNNFHICVFYILCGQVNVVVNVAIKMLGTTDKIRIIFLVQWHGRQTSDVLRVARVRVLCSFSSNWKFPTVSRACIFEESKIIPRYSTTVSGPKVLCRAIGTFNFLKIKIRRTTVWPVSKLGLYIVQKLSSKWRIDSIL